MTSLPTSHLIRSWVLLSLCRLPGSQHLLKLATPFPTLLRNTVYPQFCGGETPEELQKTVQFLSTRGIGAIIDHASERFGCEHTLEHVKTIIRTQKRDVCVKLSALVPEGVLRSPDPKFHHPEMWNHAGQSLLELGNFAKECGVSVMVDAEQSYYQRNIDRLVLQAQWELNRRGISVVYNTYQMYLRDTPSRLQRHMPRARGDGVELGIKLVRGAYHREELKMNSGHLFWDNITETHHVYNSMVKWLLKTQLSTHHLVIATHNSASIQLAKGIVCDLDAGERSKVRFCQLMGMSDHITLSLAQEGLRVDKYIPYGPVEEVIPYLGRRLEENSSLLGSVGDELRSIEETLKTRYLF